MYGAFELNRDDRHSDDVMSSPLQEMLLALLIFSANGGSVVAGYLRPEHFDGVYRDVAEIALDYRRRYNRPPGRTHAEEALTARLPRGGAQRAVRILRQLETRAEEIHPEYAVARAREHIRRVTLRNAIVAADARYYGPAEGAVEEMEAILYGALRARADLGDAGTFLSDTAKGLAFLDRKDVGFYALGIPALDRMNVGLVQGELLLYLAGKGTGKTWFCVHCGRQAIIQGARVVHVTLEMDEDRVTQRYYQTFLAIANRDTEFVRARLLTEKGDPKGIKRDDQEYAVGFKERVAAPRASFSDAKIRTWIRDRIEPWRSRMSRLVVKRFPTGQLTVDALRSYLDLLEQAYKFVPNVLIVDYPDLMKLSSRDYRIDLGRLYVALRGLGVERSLAVVAPTQTNRAGLSAKITDATMVSEDKTKLDTADTVLMYSQTRQERKRGLARLTLEYSRDSERGHVIVLAQSYATGQYVIQSALQSGTYWDAVRSEEEDET